MAKTKLNVLKQVSLVHSCSYQLSQRLMSRSRHFCVWGMMAQC